MGVEEMSPNQTQITKEFLEKILKRRIQSFTASTGSNPGDNFTSILISLDIQLADEEKPLYLLFKTFPQHPTRQKLLEDTNLFLKEFQIYDIWIPELISFQKSIIRSDEPILKPAMPELVAGAALDYTNMEEEIRTDLNPMLSNFVLMVDVRKTHGYKMANKLKSLGYHHVKVVLEELAKYHALGYAYKTYHKLTNISSKFSFMNDPFFCNVSQKPTLELMLKMNIQLVVDACKDFLLDNSEIAESLSKFQSPGVACDYLHLFLDPKGMDEEKVESLMRVKPAQYSGTPLKDQWLVPGHGDCWSNNMLFKTGEDGKVNSTILVDLQIARESCIMADIVYFIYTSTDTEFRGKYLDEMLTWYYEKFVQFCEVLTAPQLPGFTLQNFHRRFHRSKLFGFIFASLVLPIILQRPETAVNLDAVELDDVGKCSTQEEEVAEMFQKLGRDEDDEKMLKDRFTKMLLELHQEGVL